MQIFFSKQTDSLDFREEILVLYHTQLTEGFIFFLNCPSQNLEVSEQKMLYGFSVKNEFFLERCRGG